MDVNSGHRRKESSSNNGQEGITSAIKSGKNLNANPIGREDHVKKRKSLL